MKSLEYEMMRIRVDGQTHTQLPAIFHIAIARESSMTRDEKWAKIERVSAEESDLIAALKFTPIS